MEVRFSRVVCAAMAVAFGAAAAFAGWNPSTRTYDTTGYVKLKTNAGDYGDTTVFDEPEKWTWPDGKVPDRMDPEADYCYDGASRYSRTPRTRDYVFNARTLAVNGQFHQSSTHWFTTTNMHLVNGASSSSGGRLLISRIARSPSIPTRRTPSWPASPSMRAR